MEDFYEILGVSKEASQYEIKKAFRKLAKQFHPDHHEGDPEKEVRFKEINRAYSVLSDPEERKKYDNQFSFDFLYQSFTGKTEHPSSQPRPKSYKKKYSPWIVMWGRIFVIILIMTIVLIPVSLAYFSSRYHYNEGINFLKEREYASALISFKRAIIMYGAKSTASALKAAEIELKVMDEPVQCIGFLNEALYYAESRKEYAQAHYLYGLSYIVIQDFDQAKVHLLESLNYIQNQDSAYYYLHEIYYKIDKDDQMALSAIDSVIKFNPKYKLAFFKRGKLNEELNNFGPAISDFLGSINNGDSLSSSYYHLSILNDKIGKHDDACNAMRLAQDYGDPNALLWIQQNCPDPD